MTTNNNDLFGWPFQNFGQSLRGTQTPNGFQQSAIIYPRRKYTFLMEITLNQNLLLQNHMQTNLYQHMIDGRLYVSLKSIDRPKIQYKTETFNSYNKKVKVPTKAEYEPISMVFHDDDSSIVMSLWKEYWAFYNHSGDIGLDITGAPDSNQNAAQRAGNALTGDSVRTGMNTRPSLGTKLRPNGKRTFFDSITIYDLGASPDSINIYTYMFPTITGWDHQPLDYYDRSGLSEVSVGLEYENYWFLIGQSQNNLKDQIAAKLGIVSPYAAPTLDGHGNMVQPNQGCDMIDPTGTDTQAPAGNLGFPAPFDNSPITSSPLPPLTSTTNQGFDLPPTAAETQQRLDTITNNLNNPDFVSTLPQSVINQNEIYQDLLTEHLNDLNAQSQAAQKSLISNPATSSAAARTSTLIDDQ